MIILRLLRQSLTERQYLSESTLHLTPLSPSDQSSARVRRQEGRQAVLRSAGLVPGKLCGRLQSSIKCVLIVREKATRVVLKFSP